MLAWPQPNADERRWIKDMLLENFQAHTRAAVLDDVVVVALLCVCHCLFFGEQAHVQRALFPQHIYKSCEHDALADTLLQIHTNTLRVYVMF